MELKLIHVYSKSCCLHETGGLTSFCFFSQVVICRITRFSKLSCCTEVQKCSTKRPQSMPCLCGSVMSQLVFTDHSAGLPSQEEAIGRRFVEEGTCKSKHVVLHMLQIHCCHLCWQIRHMYFQGSDVILPFHFFLLPSNTTCSPFYGSFVTLKWTSDVQSSQLELRQTSVSAGFLFHSI